MKIHLIPLKPKTLSHYPWLNERVDFLLIFFWTILYTLSKVLWRVVRYFLTLENLYSSFTPHRKLTRANNETLKGLVSRPCLSCSPSLPLKTPLRHLWSDLKGPVAYPLLSRRTSLSRDLDVFSGVLTSPVVTSRVHMLLRWTPTPSFVCFSKLGCHMSNQG